MPKTALIVVDMVNAYEHPDAEQLTRSVEKMLPTIAELIEDSDLTVYVNDNFGDWKSNRGDAVAHIHEDLAEAALKMMEINMSADVSPARDRG